MKPIIRSSFAGAALALGLVAGPVALGGAALLIPGVAQAKSAPTIAEMKQTLADYGQFITIEKYGEVWKPTVTPRGWHPYPACDWVYTKAYGWYFSDKTAWGSIVHHYGRWLHDEVEGWLWVPGAEFSPGWVVWRTSEEWVGWAPTPPDVDVTPAKMERFDDDKLWTFMDAKKFGATCEPGATVVNYGDVWKSTTYVTDIRFVDGISIFVLPTWIVGPVVNVDIDVFAPWSPSFVGTWISSWTGIFNDIDINITVNKQVCEKDPKDPKDPKEPKDPQNPDDPKNPNGDNPKPRRTTFPDGQQPGPSKIRDDVPPPPPGFQGRQPNRNFVDRTPDEGRGRPPKREIRTFEPQPDDVVVRDRLPDRPNRDRLPRRERGDQGREPGGREAKQRDPRRERGPMVEDHRDRGPMIDRFPNRGRAIEGRSPDRDFGPRNPSRAEAGGHDLRKPSFERSPGAIERLKGERRFEGARTFNPGPDIR